jgi:Bacteriophage head to tail connecting protein
MSEKGKVLLQQSDKVFGEFQFYYSICERLRLVFYPERGSFLSASPPMIDDYQHLANNEPARLRRETANRIGNMIRPRMREWFEKVIGDPEEEPPVVSHSTSIWLAETTKRMRRMIYRGPALFAETMVLDDNDYVTFGSSVSAIAANRARNGLIFTNKHLRNCAWQEDAERVVNVMHEKTMPKAQAFLEQFGREVVSRPKMKHVKDALDPETGDPTREFPVRMITMPAAQYQFARNKDGMLPPRIAAFAIIYICEISGEVLKEEWKTHFPYNVRRWSRAGGRPWGTSIITSIALSDSNLLSAADRSICESIEKMADPPLLAKHEAIVGANVDLSAGGLTYGIKDYDYRQGRPIEVAHEVGNPSFGMEYIKHKGDWLRAVFFESMFKLPTEHPMTLGEVDQRMEELVASVSPIFEPMEADQARMLDTVFYIGEDYQAFDPPPEEIRGQDTRYDFDTPVQRAIKQLRVLQAKQYGLYVSEMSAVDPNVGRNVNWQRMHKTALSGIGPISWLRDPDEVEAEIEEVAAQRSQQDALMMAAELGKTKPVASITDKALAENPGAATGVVNNLAMAANA